MHRRTPTLLSLLLLAIPAAVQAQACLGLPQGTARAISGSAGPQGPATFGISHTARAGDGSLYTGLSAGVIALNSPLLSVAGSLTRESAALRETVSLCPSVGARFGYNEDNRIVTVPIALHIGKTLPLGKAATTTVTPYLAPRLVTGYAWYGDGNDDTAVILSGLLNTGATVGLGRFLLGASADTYLGRSFSFYNRYGVHLGYVF